MVKIFIVILFGLLMVGCKPKDGSQQTLTNEKLGFVYSKSAPKEIIVNDTYDVIIDFRRDK